MNGKNDNTKNIIIIVLSIAVLCLVVAVVVLSVMLAKKNDEKEPSATDQFYSAVLTSAVDQSQERQKKKTDISTICNYMACAEWVTVCAGLNFPSGTEFDLIIEDGKMSCFSLNSEFADEWNKQAGGTYSLHSEEFKKMKAILTGTLQGNGSVLWEGIGIGPILEFDPSFEQKWYWKAK